MTAGQVRWTVCLVLLVVFLLPLVGMVKGKRELTFRRWKSPDYEFVFGSPPQLALAFEGETYPGIYTLDGGRIQATAIGKVLEGTWDGSRLFLACEPLKSLGRGKIPFPALPEQTFEPAQWHVIMVSHVAQGFICEMNKMLQDHGIPARQIRTLGRHNEDYEPLREILCGTADSATLTRELNSLAMTVGPGDAVLLVIASHMTEKDMSIGMTYRALDEQLAAFPQEALVVVVLEGCCAGAALPHLVHADIAYASVPAGKGSYGAFLVTFIHCYSRKYLFKRADVDGNGIVTLGEAFDESGKDKYIEGFYKEPVRGRIPQRKTSSPGLDYTVSFVPFAARLHP